MFAPTFGVDALLGELTPGVENDDENSNVQLLKRLQRRSQLTSAPLSSIHRRDTMGSRPIMASGHGFGMQNGINTPSDFSETSSVASERKGVAVQGKSFGVDRESPILPMPPPEKTYEQEQLDDDRRSNASKRSSHSLLGGSTPIERSAPAADDGDDARSSSSRLSNKAQEKQQQQQQQQQETRSNSSGPTRGTFGSFGKKTIVPTADDDEDEGGRASPSAVKAGKPSTLDSLLRAAPAPEPPLAPPPGGKAVSREEVRELRERLAQAERDVATSKREAQIAAEHEREQRERADELELMIEGGEQVRPGHTEELEKEIEKLRLQVSKLQGELGRNKAVREDDGESTRALVNEVSSLEAEKERLEGEVAKVAEQEEKWKKEISALRSQNKKLLEEVAELDEEVKKGQRGGGKDSAAARRKEMELRKEISILEDKIDMHKAVEEQLESAKGVITVLEARQAQLDDMLGGLQHERDHIDEVVSEMRKLRIQVQQKDALIAEMNDQLHSNTAFRSEDADEALLKQQQMQRDIHELRTAVQERDQIITNLNSKIQQDGLVGETARGSQIAEREKAIAEQMVHLQEVAKHQYDMQAQLMEVQEMLQQQQAQMEEQSHQQALAQQQQLQMAAQSQQLAALQQGIGSYSQAGGDSKVFRIDDVPDEDEEDEDDGDGEGGVGGGRSAVQGKSISKTPTPKEWSQEQGSINASNSAVEARRIARSAAAAASVARRQGGISRTVPTEVTM